MTRSERLGLEPGSIDDRFDITQPAFESEIAHSIAISLKRIADSLEGNRSRYGINDLGEGLVGIQQALGRTA